MQDYKSIKPIAAYIDRIGAEQLNFKRFMVKEYKDKYYIERVLIKFDEHGNIETTDPKYDPTAEELASIKEAFKSIEWPKAIHAENIDSLLKTQKIKASEVHIFWDRKTNQIKMVQQRTVIKGQKKYIPWTFFSDGEWRRMEADGPLPFWKPRERRALRIMIHEGAKAGYFIDNLVNNPTKEWEDRRKKHPWAEELAEYEHWGIIGGALAPHRSDYDELHRENPQEVVYVCDNDWPGRRAVQIVSKTYGRAMRCIKFDNHWPVSWDMADDMPIDEPTLFVPGTKRYKGPKISDLLQPATYATEQVAVGPKKKVVHVLRSDFLQEWTHCVSPDVYIHKDWPNRIYSVSELNNLISPFSEIEDVARMIKKDDASKSLKLMYRPGRVTGVYNESKEVGRAINTFIGTTIKRVKGDPAPFLEYLNRLVTIDADRNELLRWIATLIARPEIRMNYGLLLISETQGVGKTTLGEKILAPLVGPGNASFPSESDIVDSAFNEWLAHKRLIVINEIYGGNSVKGYNRLKSVVTDRSIEVNKKYQPSYTVENWAHVLACSNSLRAVKLSSDDRRWLVPKITEEKSTFEYWSALNRWLTDEDGLGIIHNWAHDWLKTNEPVFPGATAPSTARKEEVIMDVLSANMLLVNDVLSELQKRYTERPVVMFDSAFVNLIRDTKYDGRHSDHIENPLTIRKWAKGQGWYIGSQRLRKDTEFGRVITNDIRFIDLSIDTIQYMGGTYLKCSDLMSLFGM